MQSTKTWRYVCAKVRFHCTEKIFLHNKKIYFYWISIHLSQYEFQQAEEKINKLKKRASPSCMTRACCLCHNFTLSFKRLKIASVPAWRKSAGIERGRERLKKARSRISLACDELSAMEKLHRPPVQTREIRRWILHESHFVLCQRNAGPLCRDERRHASRKKEGRKDEKNDVVWFNN